MHAAKRLQCEHIFLLANSPDPDQCSLNLHLTPAHNCVSGPLSTILEWPFSSCLLCMSDLIFPMMPCAHAHDDALRLCCASIHRKALSLPDHSSTCPETNLSQFPEVTSTSDSATSPNKEAESHSHCSPKNPDQTTRQCLCIQASNAIWAVDSVTVHSSSTRRKKSHVPHQEVSFGRSISGTPSTKEA